MPCGRSMRKPYRRCFAHVRGAPRSPRRSRGRERESRRLVTRLKFANLRQNATVEDLNTKAARGLDKALFAKLATGDWVGRRQDLLITGKTGTGKSWLACALGSQGMP